ncbi:MAG: DUF523 domain-containing protein [Clostridia bacterium]|nr:DUF523 domain-containing protein [Clostridia bacterium]
MEKKTYEFAVSACLCGFPCRYDGKSKPDERIKALYEEGRALPVCPEKLGGLTTPRTPCEIIDGKVISSDGEDRTSEYLLGSQKVLELCKKHGIKKAILKQNSPSCGSTHIYDGTFSGTLIEGEGCLTALLRKNGIEVTGEK